MAKSARIARLASAIYPQPVRSSGSSGAGIGVPAPVQSLAGASGTVALSTAVSNATLNPFSGTPAALASLTVQLNPTITPPLGAFALKLLDFNGCDLSGITSIDVMAGSSVVNLDVQDPGGLWLFYFDGTTLTGYEIDNNLPAPGGAGFDLVSTGPLLREWTFSPPGGYQVTAFSVLDQGVVEVGTMVVDPTWSGTQNEVADSNLLAWTNPNGSTSVVPALSMSGTIAATFSSNTNGAASAFTLSGMKGASSSSKSTSITWAGSIVAGAETASPDPTPGQALYDSLRAQAVLIRTTIGGTFPISCTGTQIPTGAVLTSLGRLPTITSGAFTYPPTELPGSPATITENGTPQSYRFFTWATTGADLPFTFS